MKLYNVGILGATGAVGQEMMKILLERKFPVGELRPIASARSAGSEIDFGGMNFGYVTVNEVNSSNISIFHVQHKNRKKYSF